MSRSKPSPTGPLTGTTVLIDGPSSSIVTGTEIAQHLTGFECVEGRLITTMFQSAAKTMPRDCAAEATAARSTPSIADGYWDLLDRLHPRRRRGLIARLAQGYYEGWRPSHAEIAALVDREIR